MALFQKKSLCSVAKEYVSLAKENANAVSCLQQFLQLCPCYKNVNHFLHMLMYFELTTLAEQ